MVLAVDGLELLGYLEGAIGRTVVYDDDLVVDLMRREGGAEKVDDDGKVAPLIVRRQDDAVCRGSRYSS